MQPYTNQTGQEEDDFFAGTPVAPPYRPPSRQGQASAENYVTPLAYQPPAYATYQTYSDTIQSRPTTEQKFAMLPTESLVMEPTARVTPGAGPAPVQVQPGYGSQVNQPTPSDAQLRPKSVGKYNPLLGQPNVQVSSQIQKQTYPAPASNNPFQSVANPVQPTYVSSHNDSVNDTSRMSGYSRASHKSPLRTNVLNAVPGLPTEGMRRSSSGRNLHEQAYPDDVAALKLIYLARNDELKHLNGQISILEGTTNQGTSGGVSQGEDEVNRLEKDYSDLVTQNNLLQRELEQVKAQLRNTSNDFDLKIAQMKAKLQENARKNMEMYERELMFKYRNNDDETIKFLKEQIAKLERGK